MNQKKIINIAGQEIEYTLRRHPRAKQIKITIFQDGRLSLCRPWYVSAKRAEKFLWSKQDWLKEKLSQLLPSQPVKLDKKEYQKRKQQAEDLVKRKITYFNQFYNFEFRQITIRNQRTRWGSCSKRGGLNFNYRLISLPESLIDYIIVHELCHLGQMNHSIRFWTLVAKTIPDFKERRKELRRIKMILL